MKIAIVTLTNPFEKIIGGIESVVYNLSQALADLGHEVWIVCLGSIKKQTIKKIKKNIILWILPDKGKKNLLMRGLIFITSGRKVLQRLEEKGIEILNGHGGYSPLLAFYKPKRAKIVLTIHTLDDENIANIKDCIRMRKFKEVFLEIIRYAILKLWRIFYLSRADRLIFVSRVVQDEFRKHYWFLRKGGIVIPNGFPTNIRVEENTKRYDFIYVGRIDKRKCVDLIIEACKILRDRGYSFSMAIIGDGRYYSDIKKLVKKYDLDRYVTLFGFLYSYEEVLSYVVKSKFLIIPSLYESDSLVLKEALSLGVPCIVSDIPALTEKIENTKNGFIFKCLAHIDLAKVMEKALKLSEREYKKLSENAKSSLKKVSWRDAAEKYVRVWKKLGENNE